MREVVSVEFVSLCGMGSIIFQTKRLTPRIKSMTIIGRKPSFMEFISKRLEEAVAKAAV